MSSQDQNLLSSLQQQVGGDRYLPPKVLEDTPNETAEYEKEVLQGAGGLLAGGSVETYDFDLAPSTLDFGGGPFTYLGDDWSLLQSSQNPDFNIWPWSPLYTGGSNEFDKYAEATN